MLRQIQNAFRSIIYSFIDLPVNEGNVVEETMSEEDRIVKLQEGEKDTKRKEKEERGKRKKSH